VVIIARKNSSVSKKIEPSVNKMKEKQNVAYLYLLPLIFVIVFFFVYPAIFNFVISLFDWSGFSRRVFAHYVGSINYTHLFDDEYFWVALRNTVFFELTCCIFQVFFPLFFALVLFFGKFKGENIIKALIYFPALISPVVVGLVWKYILSLDGLFNQTLQTIGLDFLVMDWLGNIYTPIWIMAFINIWQFTGYGTILFLAGLSSIDKKIIEAAIVDGASLFQCVTKIVTPLLKPIIILDLLLVFITVFRIFDLVFVTTRGGPVHQSELLTTLMYYYSFDSWGPNKMGVAAAISVLLLPIAVAFSLARGFFVKGVET